ncbi:MAG: superoxide dismutase [Proteobacteria bacterium]|nr:superoxide dismutase [Pseudomonadota bacterium]NBP14366.1 superoxide dismutase [bacterium]
MYSLPRMPYEYGALEPYIEAQIMELHHAKHQQAYVNGLNAALEKHPALFDKPLVELLKNLDAIPEDIRTAVRNHGGGVLNHTDFWNAMAPKGGGLPKGQLAELLKKQFQSFDNFKQLFEAAAKNRFGSGWAWLAIDTKGDLVISSTANQDTPYSIGHIPVLGLDVWEHAYYLQYFNRRPDYITAWWNVVNWDKAQDIIEITL